MTKNQRGLQTPPHKMPISGNSFEKKKNACFIYYQYFSSLEHREANALKELGYHVDIICLRGAPSEPIITDIDGHTVYQIQSRPTAEKSTVTYFFNLGLFFVKSFFLVTWLHLLRRYRLVEAVSPPDVIVFAASVPRLFGAKLILIIHDIGPELFMRKLGLSDNHGIVRITKFLEKLSCKFAHHVITVTEPWKDRLVGRSLCASKCTVLLNVPDERIFKFNADRFEQKNNSPFNLFYHGSLEEHFGVDTMLEAMPEIRKKAPTVMLNIYGGKKGRMSDIFLNMVKDLDIDDCVAFNDTVPFFSLPDILSKADLGIVPTKGGIFSDEAVSMKSLEYLYLGIPIVISGTKAHRHYYDDSFVTFFDPSNVSDLAEKVAGLCNDLPRRKMQVRNSKSFIEKNKWEETKNIYLGAIQKVFEFPEFTEKQGHKA